MQPNIVLTALWSLLSGVKAVHAALSGGGSSSSSSTDSDDTAETTATAAAAAGLTTDLDARMASSWVTAELKEVRNCHAAFHKGLLPGLLYNGLSAHILKGREPWTLKGAGM